MLGPTRRQWGQATHRNQLDSLEVTVRTSETVFRRLAPYLFLLPAVVMMLVFVYVPIVQNIGFSLYRWSAMSPEWAFVGLDNYVELFGDALFWQSLRNNFAYAVISVAFQVAGAMVLAAILESQLFSRRMAVFFRTALFLPSVLAITVVGFTWQLLYRPGIGLINQLLEAVGLHTLTRIWLGDESTVMYAVIAVSQWQWTGYIMLLFIVAMQAIPRELYDATRIDGANAVQQFIHVTVPGVRETTIVLLAITIIGAFKVFDIVWVMTAGGPNRASEVLGSYMYRSAFRNDVMGYASAIATIIFVITLSLTYLQLRIGRTGKDA
jgi:raffinose/stachyose/melibiose transport system permease protein